MSVVPADTQTILRPSRVFSPYDDSNPHPWFDLSKHNGGWYMPAPDAKAPVPDAAHFQQHKQNVLGKLRQWKFVLDPLWAILYGAYRMEMVDEYQRMIGGWRQIQVHATNRFTIHFFAFQARNGYILPPFGEALQRLRVDDAHALEEACINRNLYAQLKPYTSPDLSGADGWLSGRWSVLWANATDNTPAESNAHPAPSVTCVAGITSITYAPGTSSNTSSGISSTENAPNTYSPITYDPSITSSICAPGRTSAANEPITYSPATNALGTNTPGATSNTYAPGPYAPGPFAPGPFAPGAYVPNPAWDPDFEFGPMDWTV
ncbi:hypothetical protein BJ508DRAFT_310451 [Ascobolus immersus RN42]|uniref:Uncharacterized protein n=1 Tax=Ascobolus immersus RN42 TaxID=1160509 RepID=A0A3N4HV84_ASCIM|nr:hypothetical protein BJ508DRAFT_310451 [Ascobolus immersus RN42]